MIAVEVLAVGDLAFQQKAVNKMSDLSLNHGRTVVFVSHNVGAVEKLCNKGLILEHGKITTEQCPVDEAVTRFNEVLGLKGGVTFPKAVGA
jgi:lipopolysaccharide transport system ATP-binding protein